MKKKIIAANFKMNKTDEEIKKYFAVFLDLINGLKNKTSYAGLDAELIFASVTLPPYITLNSPIEKPVFK